MQRMRTMSASGNGFTLIELLIVIVIIGSLMALLLPAINMVKESQRKATCGNNLHQIGVGLNNFLGANKTFPPGQKQTCKNCATISWAVLLLPFIDEGILYRELNLNQDMRAKANQTAVSKKIGIFLCPSTARREEHRSDLDVIIDLNSNGQWDDMSGEGMACMDYSGITGPAKSLINPATKKAYSENQGVLLSIIGSSGEARRIGDRHITDGMDKTLMVAECSGRGATDKGNGKFSVDGAWAAGVNVMAIKMTINQPPDVAWNEEEIFSDHRGGAQALYCSGRVVFLNESIDLQTLAALCSRDGCELFSTAGIE